MARTSGDEEPSVLEQFPWLLEYDQQWDFVRGGKVENPHWKLSMNSSSASSVYEDVVFEALMEKRREWDIVAGSGRADLDVELLGGAWTREHRGVNYDAFVGRAHGREAEDFCSLYGLQKSFRCSTQLRAYEHAHAVCTEWRHKMQWLFDRYLAQGVAMDFSDAALCE